jgi:hypothetical protein
MLAHGGKHVRQIRGQFRKIEVTVGVDEHFSNQLSAFSYQQHRQTSSPGYARLC